MAIIDTYFNLLLNKIAFYSGNFCIWIENADLNDASFKTPVDFTGPWFHHWDFLKCILLSVDTIKSADYICTLSYYSVLAFCCAL